MGITVHTESAERWANGWRPDVWLFDFDGTLVDSIALILDSYRYATERVLGRAAPDDVLRAAIGRPLADATEDIAPGAGARLMEVYRERNMATHDDLLAAYEGVDELLAAIEASTRRLGIVTSKRRDAVDLGLHVLGIRTRFDVIVTADDTQRHKPDPEPLLEALRRLEADPHDAVYVGDTVWDIRAAHAAGVASVAALWGIGTESELRAEAPDVVVASPGELLPA
jgi:pyrophosphatase PpaX